MARSVESVHRFTHDQKFQLKKEITVIRCDDGAIYEFEKPDGAPRWRFVHTITPSGTLRNTGARKALPDGVKETVDTLFDGWRK